MQDDPAPISPSRRPSPEPDSWAFVRAWQQVDHRTVHPRRRHPGLRALGDLVRTLVLAGLIFATTQSAVEGREIDGPSMQPTYHAGERLFINKLVYLRVPDLGLLARLPVLSDLRGDYLFHAPRRGETVVFSASGGAGPDLIKRVIGVPGDHINIHDGGVWVNGERLHEPYPLAGSTACASRWCDLVLGEDQYYVMGDNRGNSGDSRHWGPVAAGRILGKAWLIIHPFDEFGRAP